MTLQGQRLKYSGNILPTCILFRSLLAEFRDAGETAITQYGMNGTRGADFQVGGLTRTRKREPTRGVPGVWSPGKI